MVDGPFDPASFRRAPERRRRSFPAWAYYLVAAILFVPTIPMYRYILGRAEPQPVLSFQPAPSIAQRVVDSGIREAVAPAAEQVARNNYVIQAAARHLAPAPVGRVLAPNERCIAGTIVRLDRVDGVATYTQETDAALPLACPQ